MVVIEHAQFQSCFSLDSRRRLEGEDTKKTTHRLTDVLRSQREVVLRHGQKGGHGGAEGGRGKREGREGGGRGGGRGKGRRRREGEGEKGKE